jgi:hypothetical protein
MMNRRVRELVLISVLAAFCGGLMIDNCLLLDRKLTFRAAVLSCSQSSRV